MSLFLVATDTDRWPPLEQWPRLSICPDMGSDGISVINALQHKFGVNVGTVQDAAHGCWGDFQLCLKMAALPPWMLIMLVMFSVLSGPPSKDTRFAQGAASQAEALTDVEPRHVPLFHNLAARLMPEFGQTQLMNETYLARALLEYMECMKENSPWRVRCDKLVLDRCWGFVFKGRT